MSDIKEYIRLQRQRDWLKRQLNNLVEKDLESFLRDLGKEIDRIIRTNTDPLTLTSESFKDLIEQFARELQRMMDNNLHTGSVRLAELHNQVKAALNFSYPIDYQLFPKSTVPSKPLIREIGRILSKYRDGSITEPATRRLIKKRFGVPVHHANSYINTQLAGFDNSAAKTIADLSGLKKAIYFGPIGPNTREFCRRLLGSPATYTEQEIRRMSNGQGLPVLRYCGGYRCMHEWLWVDEEWPEVKDLLE